MFNLSLGDFGLIIGGAVAVGYGAVKYGVNQSLKAVNVIRTNDLHHLDLRVEELAATAKEQHEAISKQVDDLQRSVDFKFGELKGLDLDGRVSRLERSNEGDGPYVRRRKHSR